MQEIKEDNAWQGTQRGKYILAINDWHQTFYQEFRERKEFGGVLIGGHASKMVVLVTGKVPTGKALEALRDYVNSKNPPFKVLEDIRVGT